MNKQNNFLILIQQYEIIIASIIILLVVILLSFIFPLPNFNRAQQIYTQQKNLSEEINNLKRKDNTLASLDQQYFKDIFSKLNKILPEEKDYVTLFETFDSLEKTSGVTILRADFQFGIISTNSARLIKAPGTAAYIVPISLEIRGNYSAMQKFIESLDDFSGRIITLEDAHWSQKPDNLIQATFNGRVYFYPLPATIGSIDTPLPKIDKTQEELIKKLAQMKITTTEEIEKIPVGKKNLFQ